MVITCTTSINTKNCYIMATPCIYVFWCIPERTAIISLNSMNWFFFSNPNGKCLQRGTNWLSIFEDLIINLTLSVESKHKWEHGLLPSYIGWACMTWLTRRFRIVANRQFNNTILRLSKFTVPILLVLKRHWTKNPLRKWLQLTFMLLLSLT